MAGGDADDARQWYQQSGSEHHPELVVKETLTFSTILVAVMVRFWASMLLCIQLRVEREEELLERKRQDQ